MPNRESEADRGFTAEPDYWPSTRGNTRERMSDHGEAVRERPYGGRAEPPESASIRRDEGDNRRRRRLENRNRELLAGALGGLAGAMAMGMMMAAGKQTGMVETPPPLMIERKLERRAGMDERTTRQEEMAIASGGHLLLGAALGAGYGLLRQPLGLQGMPGGAAYGMGVYLANFAGIGPALDLTAGPWKNEPMTVGRRVMMHLLFGVVTAAVADKMLEGA